LVGAELRKLDREYLLAIYLNSRNKVIDIEVLAIGTLSQVPVHPREVIKSAILANAHSSSWFIIIHQVMNCPAPKTNSSPAICSKQAKY
jgi:DNA repair protein RadC